ncbi:hypothetical protein NDA03_23675 [Trichocoleus sp. Lan]|uniref:hypothetical protein n=1 Tax=Trichocoleus sp. Lan TaxID=2933927 RepID=UPI003296C3EF
MPISINKAETTIFAAFEAVAESSDDWGRAVRKKCREKFSSYRLMRRMITDIDQVMGFNNRDTVESEAVNLLWDDQIEWVEGSKNWSEGEPL